MSKELENSPKSLPSINNLPCPNLNQNTLPPILTVQKSASISEFLCKTCLKSFKRKNSLTRHERIHTGFKPYRCTACNKCFGRKDILESHKLSIKCQRSTQHHHNFYYSTSNHQRINRNISDKVISEFKKSSLESLLSSNYYKEEESKSGEGRESGNEELNSEQLIFKLDKRSSPWFN